MVKHKGRKRVPSPNNSVKKFKIEELTNGCADGLIVNKEKLESSGVAEEKGNASEVVEKEKIKPSGVAEEEKPKASGFVVPDTGGKRKKRKIMHSKVESNDYFSQLPDHIIHLILGFLPSPKYAARTSVLSKKWKAIWNSFPSFDFDQRCFEPHGAFRKRRGSHTKGSVMRNFIGAVDEALATRLAPLSFIQRFRLHVSNFNGLLFSPINRSIRAALKKHVKEFDLQVHGKKKHYRLPQAVLLSKTLTLLKLNGIELEQSAHVKLYNLRVLSIKNARVGENLLQNVFNSCPLIEDFRLVYCSGIRSLHIPTHDKLERVEVHECSTLEKVEIDAPNLQTFWFHGWRDTLCRIDLSGCGDLKNLTLKDSNITDELLQDQLSKFSNLQKLVLMGCSKLQRVSILSNKIRQLSLLKCWKVVEAHIDAPHLISLEYTGDKMPFDSMNVSRLRELNLNFRPLREKTCLLKVWSFLNQISLSEGFKLIACSTKTMTIYEELKGIQVDPSSRCKFELTRSLKILRDRAEESLLKIRPKVLNLVGSPNSDSVQVIRELILDRAKKPECCSYSTSKCWRHHLEDVNISETNEDSHETTFRWKWNTKTVAH